MNKTNRTDQKSAAGEVEIPRKESNQKDKKNHDQAKTGDKAESTKVKNSIDKEIKPRQEGFSVPGKGLSTITDINTVLKNFTSDPQINSKLKKFSIFNHWPEIVGKEIADKTKPQKVFKGILYISVTTPTWANELSMMSRQLKDRINDFIGEPVIKDLRFKI